MSSISFSINIFFIYTSNPRKQIKENSLKNSCSSSGASWKVSFAQLYFSSTSFFNASTCSCSKENKLSVKEDVIRIKIDESYKIKVSQTNEEPLKWSSLDENIATVNEKGEVKGCSNGITTVTAQTETQAVHIGVVVESNEGYVDVDGNFVQVFDGVSNITEITVGAKGGGKEDITVNVGDKLQLRAYVTPSDSQDPIVWKSDDESIAHVNKDGVLEILKKGKTTITAYAPNGVNGKLIVRCK